jgi:DNA-binding protein YbaB
MDLDVLRTQAADAKARLERALEGFGELQRRMFAVTATAISDDGLVTVLVGPQGRVISIDLDPRIYRRPDSRRLAETITSTIHRAADDATEQVKELCRPYFPDEDIAAQINYDLAGVVQRHEERLRGGER